MSIMQRELLIKVKNVGFSFGVDAKRKRNYVHPAFLSFFNFAATPCHMNRNDEMVLDDGIIRLENIEPMDFSEAFRFCGRQLALCHDNRLRMCRVYRITFESEDRVRTLPFVVDKSLAIPGLLGKVAIESLMK